MKKIILTIFVGLSIAAGAMAQQSFRSTYFMEGYNLRHQFNPAFAAQSSYFTFGVGDSGLSTSSNIGVNNFLFPYNGQLTTFMSSSVSADDFLGSLSTSNRLNLSMDKNLFSIGIWGSNAFYSFDMNFKTSADLRVPYSLFDFMKSAGSQQIYDISDLSARINSRLEFAFGYSRQISDIVNVGARVKFLVGLAGMNMNIDNMVVRMNEDKWSIDSKGKMEVSGKFMDIQTKGETGADIDEPSDRNMVDFGDGINVKENLGVGDFINGFGAAIDLGAEAEIIPGLRVSLAVNDLGFMSWRNTTVAETSGKGWTFDGFTDVSFDGSKDNSLSEQFGDLVDDMSSMLDFERTKFGASSISMLAATINLGVEYVMPFYTGLTAGLLSSTRVNGCYTSTEGRVFANLKPTDWFSFGLNYGLSTFGSTMGCAIGFHTRGFSCFFGTDSIAFNWAKATKEGLLYPYKKLNVGMNFGISFNLGMRHDTAPRRSIIQL